MGTRKWFAHMDFKVPAGWNESSEAREAIFPLLKYSSLSAQEEEEAGNVFVDPMSPLQQS